MADLALPLALVAGGNFLGNMLGGRLSDAVRDRALLYAVTAIATGAVAIALFAIYLVVTWLALKRHRSLHTSARQPSARR